MSDSPSEVCAADTAGAPIGLRIVRSPGRGRGLATTRAFRRGEVLERAPVVVLERADTVGLPGTRLDDYVFWWDEQRRALALGWISLCNHRCPANATFHLDHGEQRIVLRAAEDLAAGVEVTINYHGDPLDPAPVWFPVH